MTRSEKQAGRRSRALSHLALAAAVLPLAGSLACTQVRYTESFVPEGEITRVVVQSDAGLVELVEGDELRIERVIRAPEAALDLSHRIEDGTLYLEAHCATFLPCAVDTRVEVPAGMPVEVDLGSGEVWATGISRLKLELDDGVADLDLAGDLLASIGAGSIRARMAAEQSARIGVGRGDIEIEVPLSGWSVTADTARLSLVDIASEPEAHGRLELTAPAGTVTVRGTVEVAQR